jgi:putative oxidoreductase
MIAGLRRWNEGPPGRFGRAAALLFARVAIAHVFWASGRTKVEGLRLRPEVVDLFRDEYRVPILSPEVAAPLTAAAEHVLPALIVLGLLTRLSALGLAIMTLVIQIFVYPDAWWTHHALWLALLALIMAFGPGRLSLDSLLFRERKR